MVVSLDALRKAYTLLDQNKKTEEDLHLVSTLRFIIKDCESNNSVSADIEDVSSYRASILWDGGNDVSDFLDEGFFDTKIINELPWNTYRDVIEEIADYVDWEELKEDSIRMGNRRILDAISEYSKEHPDLNLGG